MQSPKQARASKSYGAPVIRKLTTDEAKQFLFHHAKLGDLSAKELLTLVLPGKGNSKA